MQGTVTVPGDKSISHRIAMLASIASGLSLLTGFSTSADCSSTLECIARLGIKVERDGSSVAIYGRGLGGYDPIQHPVSLDAGNSGSTIRMLSGLLAGQTFTSIVDGDASLRQRPMCRIVAPLQQMGARVEAYSGNRPPITITGGGLRGIRYESPISSAQVKTAVLFAGLYADGVTTVVEPSQSRNHTELMLRAFGARISVDDAKNEVTIESGKELDSRSYEVPGDPSSAAFLAAAASIVRESRLEIRNLCLNPSRTGFIEVLRSLGADISISNLLDRQGETVGDLMVKSAELRAPEGRLVIEGRMIPNLIDELPVLAVAGLCCEGRIEVRGASELRVKESDRIRTIVDGIRAMGGAVDEFEDGFAVSGPQRLTGGTIDTRGDHRIAMAFAIAGLVAQGTTTILNADCASISFPAFYRVLESLSDEGAVATAPD